MGFRRLIEGQRSRGHTQKGHSQRGHTQRGHTQKVHTLWMCLLTAASAASVCRGMVQGTALLPNSTGQPLSHGHLATARLPHRTGRKGQSLHNGEDTFGNSTIMGNRAHVGGSLTSTKQSSRKGAHITAQHVQQRRSAPGLSKERITSGTPKRRRSTRGAAKRRLGKRAAPRGAGWWSTRGRHFVDGSGNVVAFSGVNWFGFETPDAVPHGLEGRTYRSHLDQMKALGFNMIRLPFAGDTLLASTYPNPSIYNANPDLKGLSSLNVMDRIILECGKRGIKVILDYHRMHLTDANELGTWWDERTPEEVWVRNWARLAWRYRKNPTIIGADLYNEVHPNDSFPVGAPYWVKNAGPNEKYNFYRASKRVIQQIHQRNPNWIIFLEGMHTGGYWWGGNCAALLDAIIDKPAGKIAYTAHEYGPYVYDKLPQFQAPNFPYNLAGVFRKYWGLILERNYKPLFVGEFGSFLPPPDSDLNKKERLAFLSLIWYIRRVKASWTLWSWGPDSKDTGGVLIDDWKTPHAEKMQLLRPIMHRGFRL